MTLSGDASAASGGAYTLSSIAAVVIGGTSLMGGVGGAIGSIFGAFVLRGVSDLLFVFDIQPLVQPFIQGLILLGAVSLGAIRVLRAPNRLNSLASVDDACAGGHGSPGSDCVRLHRRPANPWRNVQPTVPLGLVPPAAIAGGLLPRDHRQRIDAGDPARTYRPVDSLGRHHRRPRSHRGRRLVGPVVDRARGAGGSCLRRSGRLGQRPRRCRPPDSLDGVHAGDERRRSRPGCDVHRRSRPSGPGDPDPEVACRARHPQRARTP